MDAVNSRPRMRWDNLEIHLNKDATGVHFDVGQIPDGPLETVAANFTRSDYILFGIAVVAILYTLKRH